MKCGNQGAHGTGVRLLARVSGSVRRTALGSFTELEAWSSNYTRCSQSKKQRMVITEMA